MNNVYVYTDNADVLYNKFNVNYSTSDPTVPENPPLYHDPRYECAVARKEWKVVNCSEKHHAVCQEGLILQQKNFDINVIYIVK